MFCVLNFWWYKHSILSQPAAFFILLKNNTDAEKDLSRSADAVRNHEGDHPCDRSWFYPERPLSRPGHHPVCPRQGNTDHQGEFRLWKTCVRGVRCLFSVSSRLALVGVSAEAPVSGTCLPSVPSSLGQAGHVRRSRGGRCPRSPCPRPLVWPCRGAARPITVWTSGPLCVDRSPGPAPDALGRELQPVALAAVGSRRGGGDLAAPAVMRLSLCSRVLVTDVSL